MKKIILIIVSLFTCSSVFAENLSSQIVQAEVPEVLHIEKIIVENVEYDKDDELKNV